MLNLILISLAAFIVIILIYILHLFSGMFPQSNTKKNKPKLASKLWASLVDDNVKLSFALLFFAILIFLTITFFSSNNTNDFINGIHVEFFGILFDVAVLVLLFNWINSHGERKRRIEKYKNEIDDFRNWKADEAKFRIRGSIKRLNKEGYSKVDMTYVDISGTPNEGMQLLDFSNVNLDDSNFLVSDMSYLNLSNSYFNNITAFNTKFIGSGLLRSEFIGSHLQDVDFTKAFLHGVDFRNAVLPGAIFRGADIKYANFDGAIVSEDFEQRMGNWNFNGKNSFEDYEIVKIPVRTSVFTYRLKLKDSVQTPNSRIPFHTISKSLSTV